MAIVFTGSKTVVNTLAPHLTGTVLSALLAIAPESMTVAQFQQLQDAINRVPYGSNPTKTLGSLLA